MFKLVRCVVCEHAKVRYLFSLPSNNLVDREKISAFRPLWVVKLQAGIYKFNGMSFLTDGGIR
jgi:hypothetical protein